MALLILHGLLLSEANNKYTVTGSKFMFVCLIVFLHVAFVWSVPSHEHGQINSTHRHNVNILSSTTYYLTSSVQNIVVPANAVTMLATLYGAQGGTASSAGGRGGMIASNIPVTPGQVFYLYVGGAGIGADPGYNGGGQGNNAIYSGGGGGATDLRTGSDTLYNRILVAGGGGGGSGNCGGSFPGGGGGYPSGLTGPQCSDQPVGPGGTSSYGGATSHQYCFYYNFGSFGYGGPACVNPSMSYGGAGGGGWYGGGGAYGSGGGGGSSYSVYSVTNYANDYNTMHGFAIIDFIYAPTASPTKSPSSAPTAIPTGPTSQPSSRPSASPSSQPSTQPSSQPIAMPSAQPSGQPSTPPTSLPSAQPTMQPSLQPSDAPSAQPSAQPSGHPSAQPNAVPSSQPSAQPSAQPSSQPSAQPSGQPSGTPSSQPSAQPSASPSRQPSVQPTAQPSDLPSAQPSTQPTSKPSAAPTRQPTAQPSVGPSAQPSLQPSQQPSGSPSAQPSAQPASVPSVQPSAQPSAQPSGAPSTQPTGVPSLQPTMQPSSQPSGSPSSQPSGQPSAVPSNQPSAQPSTQPSSPPSTQPTTHPSAQPSAQPSSQPSGVPSSQPSTQPTSTPSAQPSAQPSEQPSCVPSAQPTVRPSSQPSDQPSGQPSDAPSAQPSAQPTSIPSGQPSAQPTEQPSGVPSMQPSALPSTQPSVQPSSQPSCIPSVQPSTQPSSLPSAQPSAQPSEQPSGVPSTQPTVRPSAQPSTQPSVQPSSQPTSQPSVQPTVLPTAQPSTHPTVQPSGSPSAQPTGIPSAQPSTQPSEQPSSVPSSQPSIQPTSVPSAQPSSQPSMQPISSPSTQPTGRPTAQPSTQPSGQPSSVPSVQPSLQPTSAPSVQPSSSPTGQPSSAPSTQPTRRPTAQPSVQPSMQPSSRPSGQPSSAPSPGPTPVPSVHPTFRPTLQPSALPTMSPTRPGMQVYFNGTQTLRGLNSTEFVNNPVAVASWRAAVCIACARNMSEYVRVDIISLEDIVKRRLVSHAVSLEKELLTVNLAVIVGFKVSYTLEDFNSDSPDVTTQTLKDNYAQSVSNETFYQVLASEIEGRTNNSAVLVAKILPAEVTFGRSFVAVTTMDKPTASPTFSPRAPVISTITPSYSSTSIQLDLTFVQAAIYPGRVYCAAFVHNTTTVTADQIMTVSESDGDSSGNGGSTLSYGAGDSTVGLIITDLLALTHYVTFCYMETAQGVGNIYSEILNTRQQHTTTCCKSIVFTNAPTVLYGNTNKYTPAQSSQYLFSYVLPAVPLNALTITPEFKSSTGMAMSGIIAASPANATFTATSPLAATFLITIDESSFTTDNYMLTLLITGDSSAEYSILTQNVRILASSEVPPPPRLLSAAFTRDGGAMNVLFDSPTNQPIRTVPCNALLDFIGVSVSTCAWISNKAILISFPAYNESVPFAEPGNLLALQANKFTAACVDASCKRYAVNSAQNVTITAPDRPLSPNVVILLPSRVASCENVTIDASSSSGHGGRPWKYVHWIVRTNTAFIPTNTTLLEQVLNRAGRSLTQSVYLPAAEYFSVGVEYTITMYATNFLGKSSSASVLFALSTNPNMPIVQILGPSMLTYTPGKTITLYSASTKSLCAERNVQFTSQWRIYDGNDALVSVPNTSKDSAVLIFSSSLLSLGGRYRIVVTTTAATTSANPSVDGSAVAYVTVVGGKIVPVVRGGEKRLVWPANTLFCDASASYDENTGPGSGTTNLAFKWSCEYLTTTQYGTSCDHVLVSNTTALSVVSIRGAVLTLGDTYSVQVIVTAADGRTGRKTIIFQVQNSASSTSASITSFPTKINANNRLIIAGLVSAQYNLTASWSASINGASFPLVTQTPQVVKFDYEEVRNGISYTLLVPGGTLSAGSSVTFQLFADRTVSNNYNQEGDTAGIYAGYSEITIDVNAPPTAGTFTTSPSSGNALSTLFQLAAPGWTDDFSDLPLMYAFSCVSAPGTDKLTLQARQGASAAYSVLPASRNSDVDTIFVFASIYDIMLAFSEANATVAVTPPSPEALNRYIADELDTFYTTKNTKQASLLVNNVLSTISPISCSSANSSYCASLNRLPCSNTPHTCSTCLDGYTGVNGHANTQCVLVSEFSRLVGANCTSNSDCSLAHCVSNLCTAPMKQCSSADPYSACSGHGTCVYTDNTGRLLSSCTVLQPLCSVSCRCNSGYGGYDCSTTTAEVQSIGATRQLMSEVFLFVHTLSNPSTEYLISATDTLNLLVDTTTVVNNQTVVLYSDAISRVAQLAAQGYLVDAPYNTVYSLLDLVGRSAKLDSTNTSSITASLSYLTEGVLSDMVKGQLDTSVATENIKFTASKNRTSVLSALTSPTTSAEDGYGVPASSTVEIPERSSIAACDSGEGYAEMSLTQWGRNPYSDNRDDTVSDSYVAAPQIRLQSSVPAGIGARRTSGEVMVNETVAYYVTLQFNQAYNFSKASGTNTTFPECTVYNEQTKAYQSCNSCNVSSYTNTYVTFACYDITQLCNSGNGPANREMSTNNVYSYNTQRQLSNDDYMDDADGFGAQTSVTSIQYTALVTTLTSILSQNPANINFAAAKVIISIVIVLGGIMLLGFGYFRRWDAYDHKMFLYKKKELPHLTKREENECNKRTQNASVNFIYDGDQLYNAWNMGVKKEPRLKLPRPPLKKVFSLSRKTSTRSLKLLRPLGEVGNDDNRADSTTKDSVFYTAVLDSQNDKHVDGGLEGNDIDKDKEKGMNGSFYDKRVDAFTAVVNDYLKVVMPIDNLDGSHTSNYTKLMRIIAAHPISTLFFRPSLQVNRVQRWTMLWLQILCALFVDTLFFSTFFIKADFCDGYVNQNDCEVPKNDALGTDSCVWSMAESSCMPAQPPSDIMFVMILVMITLIICVPITFALDFVMITVCSKRPDFSRWGYNTDAILGTSTQQLGVFDTIKLLSPIVALRLKIDEERAASCDDSLFHTKDFINADHKSREEHALDTLDAQARAAYNTNISAGEEANHILHDALQYLTVTLRNQRLQESYFSFATGSFTTCSLYNTAQLADKVRAIEERLGIDADGHPAPLTVWQFLRYGTSRNMLIKRIQHVRAQQREISKVIKRIGGSELLSKDQALTQFFILEQFSVFRQYALRHQLFSFAVTTALPVDPLLWLCCWALLIGSLTFFLYWTLVWGISTTDATIRAWGINFAIAITEELLVVQTFRLFVLYMIANIFIKPQLVAIHRTLQRLAIEYVQDELRDPFGVIKVVQHVSPACRVASMKVSDNLAAGQILRHIDDHDIRNFRTAGKVQVPLLFLTIVAIPVVFGVLSEASGDIALDTVLPSAFSMLVMAHYMAWYVSPVLVILPYVLFGLYLLSRDKLYLAAKHRVHAREERQRALKSSVDGWRERRTQARYANGEPITQTTLSQKTLSCCLDMLAKVAMLIGGMTRHSLRNITLVTNQDKKSVSWLRMNTPFPLQGQVGMSTSPRSELAIVPVLPECIQALAKDVKLGWSPARSVTAAVDAIDTKKNYLCNLLDGACMPALRPAALTRQESTAPFGTQLFVSAHPPATLARTVSRAVSRFHAEHVSLTSMRAIVRVISSYRDQMLDGKLHYLSLYDEQLLTSADSGKRLLKYAGHVHVRDMACLLEEILYFYRPEGQMLGEKELQRVFRAYDAWIVQHAIPLRHDVLAAITELLNQTEGKHTESNSAKSNNAGYFQQQKLVSSMHAERLAEEISNLNHTNENYVNENNANNTHNNNNIYHNNNCIIPRGETVLWSDIRCILHRNRDGLNTTRVGPTDLGSSKKDGFSLTGEHGMPISPPIIPSHMARNPKASHHHHVQSIAARAAYRKSQREKLRIAHCTAPFNAFARWLYVFLDTMQKELKESQSEEEEMLSIKSRFKIVERRNDETVSLDPFSEEHNALFYVQV